jgi:hypothetical protein
MPDLDKHVAERAAVLRRLGFTVTGGGADHVVAIRRKRYWDLSFMKPWQFAIVRRVPNLDEAMVLADKKLLQSKAGGLFPTEFQPARGETIFAVYVTDRLSSAAADRIRARPDKIATCYYFPVAVDLASTQVVYPTAYSPLWLGYYGKLKYVAERMATPETDPPREPLSGAGLIMHAFFVASVFGVFAIPPLGIALVLFLFILMFILERR